MDGVKQVSEYINKNPNRKVMMRHSGGKYTFHNVSIWEIIVFWIKEKLKRFRSKGKPEQPIMHRFMDQFNKRTKILTGADIDPKAEPPKGMVLNWKPKSGYYYQPKLDGTTTNNQPLKQDQAINKPKRKQWEDLKDGKHNKK